MCNKEKEYLVSYIEKTVPYATGLRDDNTIVSQIKSEVVRGTSKKEVYDKMLKRNAVQIKLEIIAITLLDD